MVIFTEPVNVAISVFSTLSKPIAVFNSLYDRPLILAVPTIKRSFVTTVSSNFNALVLFLPNVKLSCFPLNAVVNVVA